MHKVYINGVNKQVVVFSGEDVGNVRKISAPILPGDFMLMDNKLYIVKENISVGLVSVKCGSKSFVLQPADDADLYVLLQNLAIDNYATGRYNDINRNKDRVAEPEILSVMENTLTKLLVLLMWVAATVTHMVSGCLSIANDIAALT